MNILITAGGTIERIDAVRSITNTSTGRLGSLIAKAFAEYPSVETIFYICGKNSVLPCFGKEEKPLLEIITAENVSELEDAVKKVLAGHIIDIIVHGMAVSDYRVKSVTSAALLAESASKLPPKGDPVNEADIIKWLDTARSVIGEGGKLSSGIDSMILQMERTPKIISLFKDLSPSSLLVGFKLLDHVSENALIETAYRVLKENKCAFVLANDMRDISGDCHIGYLVDENKSYSKYMTKEEIAEAIAAEAMKRRLASTPYGI